MKRGVLFVKCQIVGADSFFVLEKLHKMNICAFDVTFFDKKIILSVDFVDYKKLFAISRNMCYNIRILKYCGKVSLVKKAISKIGLTLCFVLFFALAIVCDSYVSEIVYEGDGEYFKPQISAVLEKEGITEGVFLKADLRSLEKTLMRTIDGVSYVCVKKSGRILTVETYRAEQKVESIDVNKQDIKSTVAGKVFAINVLSGTAMVSVGDQVMVGDVLIDGYFLKDEERILTYALGEVEIEVEFTYEYQSFASGEKYKNRAIVLAMERLGEKDVIKKQVKEQTVNKKTVYTVTLNYLVTIS